MGIIIYGAAGFVASTLLSRFSLPPRALTLVDRERIGQSVLDSLSQAGPPVHVIRSPTLADVAADEADVLLILAGQTDVDQALANPALAFEANMAIAIESAKWWRRHPWVRLVYLSSDEVSAPHGPRSARTRRFGPPNRTRLPKPPLRWPFAAIASLTDWNSSSFAPAIGRGKAARPEAYPHCGTEPCGRTTRTNLRRWIPSA